MSPKTRDIALIAASSASIVLFYRCLCFVGIAEGLRKTHKAAIQQTHASFAAAYRERIDKVLDICVDSGMDGDSLKAVIDITDGPLV